MCTNKFDLTKNLNIKIFKVCLRWPGSGTSEHELEGADLEIVTWNREALDFPLLPSYLSKPRGLYEELQIHSAAKVFVAKALESHIHVKKRRQLLDV